MSLAQIIDGKALAASLQQKIAFKVAQLKDKHRLVPGLAVILVGNDPASEIYVRNKIKRTKEVGMNSFEFRFNAAETTQKSLIAKIEHLNHDPKIHGILVQLPLPPHIDPNAIINAIDPTKDVDGFSVANVGRLVTGQDGLFPCTPVGCIRLLKTVCSDLTGKKAVIVGRSNIVGKPMAGLLLRENCTVTIVHSRTSNIQAETKTADILVVAVGSALMVKKDWVKPGAIVIDVGINRIMLPDGTHKLVGDVKFDEVAEVASAITPVPGGVGPMTITSLLENTIKAACQAKHFKPEEYLI